ncbi:MAG: ABC transporter permease [Acidimicrobiia bacterium]
MNESVLMLTLMAGIGLGTPLVFGTVGEILTERSGILNLGVQGMMLFGAVMGFWATFVSGSLWLGVVAALLAGAAISLIHAFNSITLRVSQIVSGLALTIFGTGVAVYIGKAGSSPLIGQPSKAVFEPIFPEAMADLPIVGPLIFGHDALIYLSWIIVAAASYYLFHTRPGLTVRAVGEDPASAEAAGINVSRVRYIHVALGGALAGLGGAYFSLALVPSWQDNPIGQAGWIAIALVILASWRPWRALWVAYLFGIAGRLNFTFQTLEINVPATLLDMLPFLLAIIAMIALTSGKRAKFLGAPAALGIPYFREER